MMHEEFDNFWLDVIEYANTLGLSESYVEEEFIIEGELIKVHSNYKKQSK